MVSCTERAFHRGDLTLEFVPVVWEARTLHPVGPAVLLANFWAVLNSALTAQLLGWNSRNLPSLQVISSRRLQSFREGAHAVLVLRPKSAFGAMGGWGQDPAQFAVLPLRQHGLGPGCGESVAGEVLEDVQPGGPDTAGPSHRCSGSTWGPWSFAGSPCSWVQSFRGL